ncbi:hypothetical protein PFISCL1PPCAC_21781, partial [Pristionchus fissidentatus]
MRFVLEPKPDFKRIKRSLTSLELDRYLSWKDDEERGIPIRDTIYGLIQSIHLTLQELTNIKAEITEEEPMSNPLDPAVKEEDPFGFINEDDSLPLLERRGGGEKWTTGEEEKDWEE